MSAEAAALACANCNRPLSLGQETIIRGKRKNDPNIDLCPACVAEAESAFHAETEGANFPAALLGGLLAAAVSALIWYGVVVVTNYELGIIAVGVGWLVAQGVIYGAGKKRGPILQIISVIVTIGAMAISEYLIVRYFLIQALIEQGYIVEDVPLLLPLEDVWFLIVEGIKVNPITLLFWGIAIWEALVLPAKRRLRKA